MQPLRFGGQVVSRNPLRGPGAAAVSAILLARLLYAMFLHSIHALYHLLPNSNTHPYHLLLFSISLQFLKYLAFLANLDLLLTTFYREEGI